MDLIVITTGQPFDEVAEMLRELGYEEDADGLLLGPEPLRPGGVRLGTDPRQRVAFPAVGAAEGGLVIFAGSARAARAALEGAGSELTPAARLVAELPGVSRASPGRRAALRAPRQDARARRGRGATRGRARRRGRW